MGLLWVTVLVFLLSARAQNSKQVRVELGQSVTLNCSATDSDRFWYMEVHSSFRVLIVRTFSGQSQKTDKCLSAPAHKYTSMEGNRLKISNITAEDCRLYFCAKTQSKDTVYEDTFQLVSDLPVAPPTDGQRPQQHTWRLCQNEVVMFISFTLNVLLVLVTGLVLTSVCFKRKTCNNQVNDPSPLTCENPEPLEIPQYEEIQLLPYRAPPAAQSQDGIYYKAQRPQATLPPQRLPDSY